MVGAAVGLSAAADRRIILFALVGLVLAGPRRGRAFWIALAAGLGVARLATVAGRALCPGLAARKSPPSATARQGRAITLLNANVLLTNRDFAALMKMIEQRDPDVVLLLEPGPEWARMIRPVYARLSVSGRRAVAEHLRPHPAVEIAAGRAANPLSDAAPRAVGEDGAAAAFGRGRRSSTALHPEPPYPADDSGERDAELVQVGSEVRAEGRAAIVMGDLERRRLVAQLAAVPEGRRSARPARRTRALPDLPGGHAVAGLAARPYFRDAAFPPAEHRPLA